MKNLKVVGFVLAWVALLFLEHSFAEIADQKPVNLNKTSICAQDINEEGDWGLVEIVTIGDFLEYAQHLMQRVPEMSKAGNSITININNNKLLLKRQDLMHFVGDPDPCAGTSYVPTSVVTDNIVGNEVLATEFIRQVIREAETSMVEAGVEPPVEKRKRLEKEKERLPNYVAVGGGVIKKPQKFGLVSGATIAGAQSPNTGTATDEPNFIVVDGKVVPNPNKKALS